METSALFKKVVHHVGDYLETDVSHLTLDSRMASSLPGLDSLKLFEMTLYLEDRFGVEFDESVIEKFETVRDLVEYLNSLLPESSRAN
jgi:acyl carrier protein